MAKAARSFQLARIWAFPVFCLLPDNPANKAGVPIMRKTESGTTVLEHEINDELLGNVTLEMHVDWALHPGRPASRTEPEEEPELGVREIRLTGMDGLISCPAEIHDAFVSDEMAMSRLRERAEEGVRERAEMALDDEAHAALEPDF